MRKKAGSILILVLFSIPLFSIELGIIGGNVTNPSELHYGISGGLGLLVPLLKMEFEFLSTPASGLMELSAAAKIRPKFGKLAPYATAGVGTAFEKINFDIDQYELFTFIGGGVHFFFGGFLSLRADIRFQNFSDRNRVRLSGGIFVHL